MWIYNCHKTLGEFIYFILFFTELCLNFLNQCRAVNNMGGICLYSYAKNKFPYNEGGILDFLALIKDESYIHR